MSDYDRSLVRFNAITFNWEVNTDAVVVKKSDPSRPYRLFGVYTPFIPHCPLQVLIHKQSRKPWWKKLLAKLGFFKDLDELAPIGELRRATTLELLVFAIEDYID